MSDQRRRDAVLAEVAARWRAMPDLRLMQLLGNCMPPGRDTYYVQDDELLTRLRQFCDSEPPDLPASPLALWQTVAYAARMHAHQVDKAGQPYVGHLMRVWAGVWRAGGSVDAQMAALLHDVQEDQHVDSRELRAIGVSERAIALVAVLTRDVPAAEYYARIARDSEALLIKAADIADNSDPVRLSRLDPAEQTRLSSKYADARRALGLT